MDCMQPQSLASAGRGGGGHSSSGALWQITGLHETGGVQGTWAQKRRPCPEEAEVPVVTQVPRGRGH